jgi:ArsR family transcriptional regulator
MNGLTARQASPERDILDRMSAVSDPIRCRVLLVLEKSELTVSELCATLQLPQSTVSRHLKVLADNGWVTARREGTSRRYGTAPLSDSANRLWRLVRDELVNTPWAHEDERRLESVLARRSARSRAFFSRRWDRSDGVASGTPRSEGDRRRRLTRDALRRRAPALGN